MRQDIDADADGFEFGRGFEDAAGDAGPVQHQSERQPADAGADDENVHVSFPYYLSRRASEARAPHSATIARASDTSTS